MSLWEIDGVQYDVNFYINSHPGGKLAILLGEGRDCTQLIKSYHPNIKKVCGILNKTNPDIHINSIGTCDPMLDDMHDMARRYKHKYGSIKMSYSYILLTVVLCIHAVYWWYQFIHLTHMSMIMVPISMMILALQLSHDGGHFAVSNNPTINYISTLTSFPYIYNTISWYLQHNISHHMDTGGESDIDTSWPYPLGRLTEVYSWKKHYKYNTLITLIVLLVFTSLAMTIFLPFDLLISGTKYFLTKNEQLFVGRYKYSLCAQFVGNIVTSVYPIYWYPNWYGITYVIVSRVISSIYFTLITEVSHNQEECQVKTSDVSYTWCQQQVLHSMDYNVYSIFWNIITGGLNAQGLHHCLPYVHHCHYPYMYAEYIQICKTHGIIPKIKSGFWDTFRGFVNHLHNLSHED
jgi:fatty acid desaturase